MTPLLLEKLNYALTGLLPPEDIDLVDWMESNIILPGSSSAISGQIELSKPMRGIVEAINDPGIERIILQKSARIGFSTMAMGYCLANIKTNPANLIFLLPTQDDSQDLSKSELMPLAESSGLDNLFNANKSTITTKYFPGGILRLVAARSPRALRRLTAKVLVCDEIDGYMPTSEGNPVDLAIKRTATFRDRKLIFGSSPANEPSPICELYKQSDRRIFEVPCPDCGEFTEILWKHIIWEKDRPETTSFGCPHCGSLIEHRFKPSMIQKGRWRSTRPGRPGIAGFRLNSLCSEIPSADWPKLAVEFLEVKDNPPKLQVFVNTILGESWKGGGEAVNPDKLQEGAKPFTLDNLLPQILWLVAGVDVQADRLEILITGIDADTNYYVVDAQTIWGDPVIDASVWSELDRLLGSTWKHPNGGQIGISACGIDAGFSQSEVTAFTQPRRGRRIFATRGKEGKRPTITRGKTSDRKLLQIIGIDSVKNKISSMLSAGQGLTFSDSLPVRVFEEMASERRIMRYRRGVPFVTWERYPSTPAEAWDCLTYAIAVSELVNKDARGRELELRSSKPQRKKPVMIENEYLKQRTGYRNHV